MYFCLWQYFLIRQPLSVAHLYDAAIGEAVVADKIPHEEVVVVRVDAERRDALQFGIYFRVVYDVVRTPAMQVVVMNGYSVHGDVIAVGKPLPVDVFIVWVFPAYDGGVGHHLAVFQEYMSLFVVDVRNNRFLVGIAVLPLIDMLCSHSCFGLPDNRHNGLQMSCFGQCVRRSTQQPPNGSAVRLYRMHEFFGALEAFLIPDFGDNGKRNALIVNLFP